MIKKTLIFFSIIYSFQLFGKECYTKNQYHEYYFLNGVNVTQKESIISSRNIKEVFNKKKVHPLYNPTNYQDEHKGNFIKHPFYITKRILKDVFTEMVPQKNYEQYEYSKKKNNLLGYTGKKPENVSLPLVNKFKELLSNKSNIIFAHSQGNMVANQLCHHKGDKKVEIVSLASPAGETPCNQLNNYELFHEDKVISGFRKVRFADNFLSPTEKIDDDQEHIDFLRHEVPTYLSNKNVLERVKSKLKRTEEMIYEKNMNFNFITLDMKVEGIKEYNILAYEMCNTDELAKIGIIEKLRMIQENKELPSLICEPISKKTNWTDRESYQVINSLKLGNSPQLIGKSIALLYTKAPHLFQFIETSSLNSKLTITDSYKANNMLNIENYFNLLSIKSNQYVSSINCLDVASGINDLKLNITNYNSINNIDLIINNKQYKLSNDYFNDLKHFNIGKLSVLLNIKDYLQVSNPSFLTNINNQGKYTLKMTLNPSKPSNINRTMSSTTFTYDSWYCNTLAKIASKNCEKELNYLSTHIFPYL